MLKREGSYLIVILLKRWRGGGNLFDKRGFTLLLTATLPVTKTHITFFGRGWEGWCMVWVGMDLT